MTAPEFIEVMRRRGLYVGLEGGGLVVEMEEGAARLTQAERDALVLLKADLLRHLRAQALGVGWSKVSLFQLDQVLEVAVPFSDVPLILAPGCRVARALRETDAKPGRVWCVCEVADLLLSGIRPEDARKIAEAKLIFDGPPDPSDCSRCGRDSCDGESCPADGYTSTISRAGPNLSPLFSAYKTGASMPVELPPVTARYGSGPGVAVEQP